MGFDLNLSVSALVVFLQGLLSFFSPCVFPLIPLYIGYLSGGTVSYNKEGEAFYNQKKVMLHTVCFVLGISFAFFLLGLGVSALGVFLNSRQKLIAGIGGVIIILFGLYQLGVFGASEFLSRERRLPFQLDKMIMSPFTALIMGFTFSFAWTPCVGPALTSVLLMTASADSQMAGFWLIGLYTLGFIIPFLLVGFFTTKLLSHFRKHRSIVKHTVKIGGVLMILMGIMMLTGTMNSVTGYFARMTANNMPVKDMQETTETEEIEETVESEAVTESAAEAVETEFASEAAETEGVETEEAAEDETDVLPQIVPALDFTLADQYGEIHSLSDYKGKTIFLNFWATWCPPCRNEMPEIQKLYETRPTEGDEAVIILGVAAPDYGQEGSVEEITSFLEENGYTYPVLMDSSADLFTGYGIYSLPTTFMIDRDGNIFGYVTGQLSEEIMNDIIEQTLTGERKQ